MNFGHAIGVFLGHLAASARRRLKRTPASPKVVTTSNAQMKDLRDQYTEEMNERARKFCDMMAATGATVVSVEPDGRAQMQHQGRTYQGTATVTTRST
jgi:hypothetical protein